MDNTLAEDKSIKRVSIIALICLIMLFSLRILILGFLYTFLGRPQYLVPVYMIGTYFFTALFIWVERNRIGDYHIDKITIFIFALGPIRFEFISSTSRILLMIVGLSLVIGLLLTKTKLNKISTQNIKWIFIGVIVSVLAATVQGYFGSKQVANLEMQASFSRFITFFITQLTNAAVFEEPFFRGCLWGVLRKFKCNEVVIYFIQVVLFWLGHLYYYQELPYSFWIIVPLGGLVLGFLAWRSRSISTSMVAHGIMNSLHHLIIF